MDVHLASVLDGDHDAYQHIVRRYQADVWPIAAVLLDDREATEQFVAEVFHRVYHQLDRYDPQYDFGAFVKTVAREAVRERLAEDEQAGAPLAMYRRRLSQAFADDATAVRYQRRLRDLTTACLTRVPDNAQSAIELHYKQGMDYREISGEIRRPIASIRQLLNRARTALAGCLSRSAGQTGGGSR
jgi:RNA polymerase sigma-70 factor (ECF subfamily)